VTALRRLVRLGAVAALLCAAPVAAGAQPGARTVRIGVLELMDAAANAENLDAFRRGLGELGYAEGRHFVLEYRTADGRPERFADLARELVGLGVDVMVTRGTPAALAAKRATSTIPVVMASSGEPAIEGVVASLARPGGNITGFHGLAPVEVGGRRLRLLREAVPAASRIAVLWNPADVQTPLLFRETERVARTLGVRLRSLELQTRQGLATFDRAFEAALMDQVDALIAVEDLLTMTYRGRILEFAAMSRLPAIYGLREFVDAGGLMSYGTDRRDLYRRSAAYVHRILNGAKPASLPVQAPTRFELAINLKTARALGLAIPPSLVQRADHLVQ
jgi:putative ABC transport system substrate-binding protein